VKRTLQAASAILIVIVGLLATTVSAQPYSQSPYLDERVASGELPPLEERLPEQPMVYETSYQRSEIGVYGGTFNVFALDNFPWNALTEEPARGPFGLLMTLDGEFIPDIALDFEQSEDFTITTIHLRPGMKWSNGDPFTSEDITFKREFMSDDGWQQLYSPDAWVEAPDEYTVIIHHNEARPRTLLDMVHWRGGEWTLFNPSNWLKQWHAEFNEDAEALAMEEGFETWEEAFQWHYNWRPLNDTNKPTTQPWMPLEFTTTARLYERNPYFHQVDSAGQQLPYVDRILSQIVDAESYNLKIVSGEADIAFGPISMEDFTLFKESEEAGNYVVTTVPTPTPGEVVYYFNLSHPNPVWRELFNTAEFRQALSIAIDRDELTDVIYNGFGKPLQFTVTEFSPLYESEWGEAWAQFDPDLANSMLDDIGLSERNRAGIRLDSAGNPLVFVLLYAEGSFSGAATSAHELVQEYWGDVGIQMEIRTMPAGPYRDVYNAMGWDVTPSKEGNGEMYATILTEDEVGFRNNSWAIWRSARAEIETGVKTLEDFVGGVLPGEEPPAEIVALFDLQVDLQRSVFGSAEYERLVKAYFQALSDETYAIGTVGQSPSIFIARPNIGNLPDQLPPWAEQILDVNHFANLWFYRPE
jgi:peptide/nickel transport system substrate-binding protein